MTVHFTAKERKRRACILIDGREVWPRYCEFMVLLKIAAHNLRGEYVSAVTLSPDDPPRAIKYLYRAKEVVPKNVIAHDRRTGYHIVADHITFDESLITGDDSTIANELRGVVCQS